MLRASILRARVVGSRRGVLVAAAASVAFMTGLARGGTPVTFERQANGQMFTDSFTDGQGNTSTYNYTWPDNANWSQSKQTGTSPVSGRTITLAPSNWSQDTYPNGDYDVSLGGNQVTDDISVSVDTLSLSGELDILGSQVLTVTNGSLVNNGKIVVDWDTSNYGTALNFSTDASISGTGQIVLNNDGGAAQLNAGSGSTVTIGSGQTVSGLGQMNGNFINNGAIRATVAAGTIAITGTMTNNNIIQADDKGTITFNGTMTNNGDIGVVGNDFPSNLILTGIINNSSNGLVAVGGSLYMDNVAIDGGMVLASSAGAYVQVDGSSTITNAEFNLGGGDHLDILAANTLTFGGSMNLVNDGTITVNSNNLGYGTVLIFNSDVTVNGSGDILLTQPGYASQVTAAAGATVTLGAGQTLHGTGHIGAAIINQGTISADAVGQSLFIDTYGIENDNLMQANNQSMLNINNITVTNTNGQVSASNQSSVVISGSTIDGGSVSAASDSYIKWNSGTMSGAITLSGTQNITNATVTTFNGSTLTNNGKIVINPEQSGYGTVLSFDADATLNGTGEILLDSAGYAAQVNVTAGHTLTIQGGQMVDGQGMINGDIANYSQIVANVAGQTLQITPGTAASNYATLASSNGANLELSRQFNNYSGIYGAADSIVTLQSATISNQFGGALNINGELILNGSTIDGGSINASSLGASLQVGGSSTISNADFTLGAGNPLDILASNTLTFSGAMTMTNDGTITVNSNNLGYGTVLIFNSDVTVNGSGDILLTQPGYASQVTAAAGATVTLGSGQTLHGTGHIGAAIINQGTISADVVGTSLDIDTDDIENDNLMQATNQSLLNLNNIIVTNTSGQISASNQSAVAINGSTIDGGSVSAASDSYIQWNNGIMSGAITLSGTQNITNATVTTFNGTSLTNNGKIVINPEQTGYGTVLNFDADVTLNGSGQILLNSVGAAAQLNVINSHTLTIGSAELIDGLGDISGNLINHGTISADVVGQSLNVSNFNVENDHIVQANNQSILNINSVAVANAAGQIAASNQSTVVISNSTITGGTVSATSNSHIDWDNSTLSGSITLSGTQNIPTSTTTTVNASTLTNNGKIVINSDQLGYGTVLNFDANTSLAGTGQILLNYAGTAAQLNVLDNHLVTIGSGQLIHGQGIIGGTFINTGTIRADAAGQSLEITDAIVNNAKLDVAGGLLVLDQGVSGATIISQLHSGFANGAWNGTGIISSLAHASTGTGVGYTNVGAVYTLKYTWLGDTNLDGVVDNTDLMAISLAGATWATGDFNYDGKVNADDYSLFMLGAAYGSNTNISTTLPEPAGLLMTSGGLLAALLPRRRAWR